MIQVRIDQLLYCFLTLIQHFTIIYYSLVVEVGYTGVRKGYVLNCLDTSIMKVDIQNVRKGVFQRNFNIVCPPANETDFRPAPSHFQSDFDKNGVKILGRPIRIK